MAATQFTVSRWSGRACDKRRVLFTGSEDQARERFKREAERMRCGELELYGNHDGEPVYERRIAPLLRTRW